MLFLLCVSCGLYTEREQLRRQAFIVFIIFVDLGVKIGDIFFEVTVTQLIGAFSKAMVVIILGVCVLVVILNLPLKRN